MGITKEIWKEILSVLNKYNVSYTTRYEDRDNVHDKHIYINLVIPDYFEDKKG